jgi:hypothetical protein
MSGRKFSQADFHQALLQLGVDPALLIESHKGYDAGSETALAVIPKNELAIAEKQYDKTGRKANANGLREASFDVGLFGGLGGLGTLWYAATLIHPVTAIVGGLLLLCGGVSVSTMAVKRQLKLKGVADAARKHVYDIKDAIANEQADAVEARREAMRLAAQSILMRDTGAYTVGQELRVEVPGETPKILRVKNIATGLDDKHRPVRTISAHLYETEVRSDKSLKRGQHVANVATISVSVPLEADLAPSLPSRSRAEKKLPRITPG